MFNFTCFFVFLLLLLCSTSSFAFASSQDGRQHVKEEAPPQQHPRFRRHLQQDEENLLLSELLSEECQAKWNELHSGNTQLRDAYNRQLLEYNNGSGYGSSSWPLYDDSRCAVVQQQQQQDDDGDTLTYHPSNNASFHVHCDFSSSSSATAAAQEYHDACNAVNSTVSSNGGNGVVSIKANLWEEEKYNITCYMTPWDSYYYYYTNSSSSIFSITHPRYWGCYPSSPSYCTFEEISNQMTAKQNLTLSAYEGRNITWYNSTNLDDEYDVYYLHGCAIGDMPLDIFSNDYNNIPPWEFPPFDFNDDYIYNTNNDDYFNNGYYGDQQKKGGGLAKGFVVFIMVFVFCLCAVSRSSRQQIARHQHHHHYRGGTTTTTTTPAFPSTTIANVAVAPNTTDE